MTETVVEVVWAILSLLGSSSDDLPRQAAALLDLTRAREVRGEREMSEEEQRLMRFWRGYYGAMARYYGDLDKLDWVAYYKNHGQQINLENNHGAGGSGRVLFAPVVVMPRMEWAVPMPGKVPPGLPALPAAPASLSEIPKGFPFAPQTKPAPQLNPRRTDIKMAQHADEETHVNLGFGSDYYRDRNYNRTIAHRWNLKMKIVEAQAYGAKDCHRWPTLMIHKEGSIRTGTVQDVQTVKPGNPSSPASTDQPLPIGVFAKGKITAASAQRVRLELTLEKNEVENAGTEVVVVSGKTYRLAQQLQLGQRTMVVLQTDSAGEAKLWLELIVTEAEPNQTAERLERSAPGLKPPTR